MFSVCPSCGDEFPLATSRRNDCDAALVSPDADPVEGLPPATELDLLTTGGPWELQSLAEHHLRALIADAVAESVLSRRLVGACPGCGIRFDRHRGGL